MRRGQALGMRRRQVRASNAPEIGTPPFCIAANVRPRRREDRLGLDNQRHIVTALQVVHG